MQCQLFQERIESVLFYVNLNVANESNHIETTVCEEDMFKVNKIEYFYRSKFVLQQTSSYLYQII